MEQGEAEADHLRFHPLQAREGGRAQAVLRLEKRVGLLLHLFHFRTGVEHVDGRLAFPGRVEGGFIDEVAEVGAGETDGAGGDALEIDVVRERDLANVNLENAQPAFAGGAVDGDVAIEPARTQQRGVEHVRAVSGGDDDDGFRLIEAVHLAEDLV